MLALVAALVLAAAAPASAVTRKQAAKRALAALGSKKGSDPVIVFGLTKPLRAGTKVTQGGRKAVATVGGGGGWFFYEDSAPNEPYGHPGRVALVGARSGKVKLSRTISSQPRLNGRLPAFLATSKAYRSSKYRVFERAASTSAPGGDDDDAGSVFGTDTFAPGGLLAGDGPNSPPKADRQDVVAKQDAPKSITLTGSDDDGDMLIFVITKQPDHGTLSGAAPNVVYTPNPGFLGQDSFSFKTDDDKGGFSNTAKVSIDVRPVGSPPTVTASGGCTAYVEQTAAVVVDGSLTVADPDDTVLSSARVRVSSNWEESDDLLFTDQNGIGGSYDDSTGVLTLTGNASVADYQAALRTVRYRNLASGTPFATKGIEFTANDAGSDSAPSVKQVCITEPGANNKPIGETSEGGLQYVENDGPVPVDGGFFVVDPDSAQLSGATIKFAESQPPEDDDGNPIGMPVNNFTPAEDELAFTDQNGITGSYDDVNGVMTLSGTASVADYEAALRSVTYENSSENPFTEPRTIRFQVTDSSGASSVPSSRGILITSVNDAPVVTPSDGVGSYTEGDPATAIDSSLTVGDVDDTQIEGGQVRISGGFEPGDDLVFVDQLGISGVYNTGTGVLTLTGTASVADYQTALSSIKLSGTSDDPPATKTVEYTVSDGDLDSNPATRGVAVTGVNDAPVLASSDGSAAYAENDPAAAVDPGIAASDVDSDDFAGATVQITGGFSADEDELLFDDQNGIAGSYDSSTGTLTLTGAASVADYEAALRSVAYRTTSDNPSTATRTVTFQVDDGGATDNLSNSVTRDVAVTAVNDASALATSEGSTSYTIGGDGVQVDPLLIAEDVDDANLEGAEMRIATDFQAGDDLVFVDTASITGVYNTGTGVLTLTGTASVADYQAALRSVEFRTTAESPTPSRTVEVEVDDGELDSATASKSIDLVEPPSNAAPVVTTSPGATTYTIGDTTGVDVDSAVTVTDADDVNVESAQVRVSSGFDSGDDLVYVDQLGIGGVYNTGTGVLTLTGTASLADYETALRSIKYRYTGEDPPQQSKTVEFKVNDGDTDSNASDRSVLVIQLEL
ncbi:MAG TPA: Ig-like domain-containing protein [Thermoleophilaceae bacterium]